MTIPEKLKFTKDHEWVKIEGDVAVVGVTEFAQSELGDIVFVEIETLGESLEKEAVFGTIEAVKTVSDLYMPVDGKIVEVNEALTSNPELVNKEPYEGGWMVKIKAVITSYSIHYTKLYELKNMNSVLYTIALR